jgi:glutamate N-acetyltransferase / amino-acid N-acetyltransferase
MKLSQQGTSFWGGVFAPKGFTFGATACGLKPAGALDLALFLSDRDAAVAGVFTRNQFAAAPVKLDRSTLATNRSRMRAIIANAGNANACTGEQGERDAAAMQTSTARVLGLSAEQVFVLSTGVIGVPMPMNRLVEGIAALPPKLGPSAGADAAQAIMTTDTKPKHASVEVNLGTGTVRISGVAKGSGMIHPNMATMLGVLVTDALVPPPFLQAALERAVNVSFNAISVDGDTSTNDTVVVLANGASGVPVETPAAEASFQDALTALCTDLAKQIVRDGEGATRFVELHVDGLKDDAAARAVASTIATSPLVKTAFAGGDPNWGRILAAAGRAGVSLDISSVSLTIDGLKAPCRVQLVRDGTPTGYAEADAAAVFAQSEISIHLRFGSGPGQATMWTTDLTHDYVRINADYRS